MTSTHEGTFEGLRAQLQEAAATFADGPDALEGILLGIVDDVDHAVREPLEIFPVCHHSPASAIAMARRLREKQPKVIYLELCEDMAPLLTELRNCKLPVAVQSFAAEVDGFPVEWSPLSVVAPITEASAEYQAIAYALDTPGVELVLVDRSSDHVFQWDARATESAEPAGPDAPPVEEEAALHGDAVGVEIGDLRPRFAELEEHLLRHGKVRHWSEWWHQYVELPLGDSDHDTYRQVMLLIGSLFRRLAPGDSHRLRVDEDRERYMWTRMREHLAATGTDPADCLYVCGAFHAASRVAEFGVHGADTFEISPPSATTWQHGLIPSSHAAIEAQFGLAAGSVSIAATVWAKNVRRTRVEPFRLAGQAGAKKSKAKAKKAVTAAAVGPALVVPPSDRLTGFLQSPPALDRLDEAELLGWSVEIVRAARRNGYLASTADAIAVFETSILLAGMRDRAKPTPYDFQDAAVTCIEKDTVPGRRDVRRLVEIMMGGDRVGQVGYAALPPLARDVHDRLAPLGLKLQQSGVQRALLDIVSQPELERCSDALWMLRRLLPQGAARPIMGDRKLGSGRSRNHGTSRSARTSVRSSSSATRASASNRCWSSACAARRMTGAPPPRPSWKPSRTRRCTCAAAASPTNWAHTPCRCCQPNAASTVHRRYCAGYGDCWRTTAPANRYCRPGSNPSPRPDTPTTAPCCRQRSPTRTPPSARWPRCWASCSAWRAWHCRWAATGPNSNWPWSSRIPRRLRRRRCCGRPRCSSGTSPARTFGRTVTNCWATPWWCPPIRATSAASYTPWSPSRVSRTSWWRRCRTRSDGCRIECSCPGCRP